VEGAVIADGDDRSRLDLRLVATRQLLDAGLDDDRIELSRDVTDGGEVFFSDRAQRPCGRFALVARRAVA
jgi:copper oxidase (laccase) domain-containing protein